MVSTYIPLYRKYRPETFADLVGQGALVKTLTNAIDLGRVAHAYLFTGPRGTGKTSSARIFARSLNCEKGPTAKPCMKCNHCQNMANGTSMDVIEIDAASNNSVEHARNLLEKVQFVPVSGKYKIYIIDEVHMLSTAAFNTLLKTLEEPPKNLIFILATTEPHKVLETIISRCQRFDFRRIQQQDIFNRLKEIAGIENISINDSALSLISRKSSGGLRDALALLDQASVLTSSGNTVTDTEIMALLGTISEEVLHKIVETLALKKAENLIAIINELIQMGNEPLLIIRELMTYFRNLMLIKTTDNGAELANIIDASEQFISVLKTQSEQFEVIEIAQIIEKLSEYERTLKSTTNQYLWLEVALISICYREDIKVISDMQNRLDKLEAIVSGGAPISASRPVATKPTIKPPVASKPVTPPISAPTKLEPKAVEVDTTKEETPEVTPEPQVFEIEEAPLETKSMPQPSNSPFSGDLGQDWALLLENIGSIPSRMFLHSLAKPVEISTEKIIITFANETLAKQAQEKSKLVPLEKAAEALTGTTPRLIARTPLPEDQKKNNNLEKPTLSAKRTISQNKPATIEESQSSGSNFNEQKTKIIATPKIKTASNEKIEDATELIEKQTKPGSYNLSDQAKTVLDLFQGKIIEVD